jgi:hypothetical protein
VLQENKAPGRELGGQTQFFPYSLSEFSMFSENITGQPEPRVPKDQFMPLIPATQEAEI